MGAGSPRPYVPYTATWSLGGCGYVTPDAGKPKTQFAYDALGRVTTVTNPDATTVRTFYDGTSNGSQRTAVDEKSHQKVYTSDVFGRLVQVKEYSGAYPSAALYATTGYAYDLMDLLTTVTDAASNQTTITYDSMGRKTGMNDPDMGTWQYDYDNAGNLKWQRDANLKYTCFCYDALNRLTGKHYRTDSNCSGVTSHVEYLYDSTAGGNKGIGYRTGMKDNPTTWSSYWKYDSRGRVISETKTIGASAFCTQWTYNSRDQVATQVYPGGNGRQAGETVTTAYGKWGQPAKLTGSGAYEYVSAARPDGMGRIDFMSFGNSQQTDWVYYPPTQKGGRLYQLKTGTSGSPTASQYLEYNYDNAGNVASIKDYNNSSQVQTFTYEDLDRLIGAVTNAAGADQYTTRSYTYSTIGNIVNFEGVMYQYQDSAHKHAVTHLSTVQKYWYDANGNQTKRIVGTNTFDLTYDRESRLSEVKKNSVRVASFTYDGDGARIRSVITDTGTTTTCFVGSYYEWTTAGTSYYYLWGQRVAKRTAAGVTHIHGDHLGSGVKTTGLESTLERYYPYGAQRGSNAVATPYRFTGQYEQGTIGLYYYNARWYDVALGRFIQPDTIVPEPGNPQALNRYSYVGNNPTGHTDPSGHVADPEVGPGYRAPRDPRLPVWVFGDKLTPQNRERAEAAYLHFLEDPAYFLDLWMNQKAWGESEEVRHLAGFAENSELRITAQDLVERSMGGLSREQREAIIAARWENVRTLVRSGSGAASDNSFMTLTALGVSVSDVAKGIAEWLGPGAQMKINQYGDHIFVSADNTQRIRFDINHPWPHSSPHANIEWREGGSARWYRSGPIYPYDVEQR